MISWAFLIMLPSDKCDTTLFMIYANIDRYRTLIDTVRQQAITWTNTNLDLFHHGPISKREYLYLGANFTYCVLAWWCYWLFVQGIHRSPVNSLHKGQWRGALMFSLICTWTNRWVSNKNASDSRCHHAHYDVTVMGLVPHSVQKWLKSAVFLVTFGSVFGVKSVYRRGAVHTIQ